MVELASNYSDSNPRDWFMSEKLDGVRALWDGETLWTRNGNEIPAPAWFIADLPKMFLDGELWMGRGMFQQTAPRVRSGRNWEGMTFVVFDAPDTAGDFASRLAVARNALAGCAHARVLEQVECTGRDHLAAFFTAVVAAGGEGVMLRHPTAAPVEGRSKNLLKLKPTQDAEALIVGEKREGGLIRSLVCSWGSVVFDVGCGLSDAFRASVAPIGERVTFAFNGVTDSGLPRFPRFVAVRNYE